MSWPCDRHQRCREMEKLPSSSNTDTVESLQSSVVCVSVLGTWRGGHQLYLEQKLLEDELSSVR